MSEILFLAHRMPFPPDRGDKIRSFNILKALATFGPVHVGCFAEGVKDRSNEDQLAAFAKSHFMPLRSKPLALAGIEALVSGQPVSLTAFQNRALAEWVEHTLATRPIDTIYVFSGQMGQYVPRGWQGRTIVDLVDVDSAKFEDYARRGDWPKRWIDRREARLLEQIEARFAARATHTLLVSEAEAELLRSRLPQPEEASVRALGNGIDAHYFDPDRVRPHEALATRSVPHIVFTGQMDYLPNIEAVKRFCTRVLPAVQEHIPETRFHIVGREPTPEVLAFDGKDNCTVWGEVPDVRPFLAAANVVVAPLRIARGVQNKVLEAMAMARPVLLTPQAAKGIPASDGLHFVVADTDHMLAESTLRLLGDAAMREMLGLLARKFVVNRMNWERMLADLPEIVGHVGHPAGDQDRLDAA